MRTIERAGSFKRDYKREAKGQYRLELDGVLMAALLLLVQDETLAPKLRDHDLTGNWQGFRECHLKPDLLLIYRKYEGAAGAVLQLARLGSHSELFG
jgi:mRNA interferase YafQ